MRELKLIKGEGTYRVDVATLVNPNLNEEDIKEILGDIAFERVVECNMMEDVEICESDTKLHYLIENVRSIKISIYANLK